MILIVDDSPDMLLLMRIALESGGYQVQSAANGAQALRLLQTGPRPELMFLDRQMDVMSGDNLLKNLDFLLQNNLPSVPVVLLTGTAEPLVNPFVVKTLRKPFDLSALLAAAKLYARPRSEITT